MITPNSFSVPVRTLAGVTMAAGSDPVILYIMPDCPLCTHARAWLRQHDVKYLERDVKNDFGALRAMYALTRQRFVPVFESQGRALVRPSDEALAEFLL